MVRRSSPVLAAAVLCLGLPSSGKADDRPSRPGPGRLALEQHRNGLWLVAGRGITRKVVKRGRAISFRYSAGRHLLAIDRRFDSKGHRAREISLPRPPVSWDSEGLMVARLRVGRSSGRQAGRGERVALVERTLRPHGPRRKRLPKQSEMTLPAALELVNAALEERAATAAILDGHLGTLVHHGSHDKWPGKVVARLAEPDGKTWLLVETHGGIPYAALAQDLRPRQPAAEELDP